jgi:hypothetical protein
MNLTALMRHAIEMEGKTIAGGGEVLPKFIALGDDGLTIFATPWRDEADKVMILGFLRHAFAAKHVTRYVMVSEAWMAMQVNGDERMPSERPDRVDCLWVVGVEYGRSRTARCLIRKEGEKRACQSPEWDGYTNISGRMADLLPERRFAS